MKKEILRIENLNYYYFDSNNNKKKVLKNVDLSLYENESLCILGQTGCGKSTLVKMLVNMIPDNATYSVNKYEKSIDRIGLVLQDSNTSLNPTLKIKTQFGLFIKENYKNISNDECKKLMKKYLSDVNIRNIDNVINKYPLELSRGMNQRITIAMALVSKPKVLILDEPTSSIDAANRKSLIKLLLELKEKYEMSLIYVTHDLKLAEDIADRLVIMLNGEIVENINKKSGIFNYKSDYAKKLKETSELEIFDNNKKKKEVLLEVKRINKSFNKQKVLEDISFDLYKGETMGIIGPSGSGKSTLCKILMGIYEADSGSLKKHNNAHIDMIHQDAKIALDPNMKIINILNELNNIKKKKRFSIDDLIPIFKEFNLSTELLDRYPYELSGGQRQLILIIRSILYNTEILILDEPTSSLDVSTQKKVLEKLKNIKEKYNLTYIFISHDEDVIKYMCDRVINITKTIENK